jgi:hypothetical protein
MANRPHTEAELQQAMNAVAEYGSISAAARALKIPRNTLDSRYQRARDQGVVVGKNLDIADLGAHERIALQDRVRDLEALLKSERRERLSEDVVRKELFGLSNAIVSPPRWAIEPSKKVDRPGIPSLFLSDLHWGEIVLPGQIHGKNEYNVSIAKKRLQRVISKTITLCFEHMTNPEYPGIVVNLGGDLVSGDIHEELSETNEFTSGQTLVDIVGALAWALGALADRFGKVWVVAVAGNHGRMTHKPRAKNRAFTNFDWVIAQLLQRQFAKDGRFAWLIPDGPDAWYRVFNYRYLLTHGDQFRGGDGIIGALGPILRGDTKKRARNGNIDLGYDTMLLGHWHQYLPLGRVIVNGSMKGYDEYAMMNNFGFEAPIQALWFTHPKFGITSHWGVRCEEPAATFKGAAVQLGEMPEMVL